MGLSDTVPNQSGPVSEERKILSFEQIKKAPSDLFEETIEIPEWGGHIRLRSLTAAQSTTVRQEGLKFKGSGDTDVAWERMETLQVTMGLVDPPLTEEQVRELRLTKSASGFQRIIDWLDTKSGMDKEELRKAQQEFQGSDD